MIASSLGLRATVAEANLEYKYVLVPTSSAGAGSDMVLWESGNNRKLEELVSAAVRVQQQGAAGNDLAGCGDHLRHALNVAP